MKLLSSVLTAFFILIACRCEATAQWVPTGGPGGADIAAFAASGSDLYASTYGSGVFHSTNNGATWSPVNTGLPDLQVWAFAAFGNDLFAGTQVGGVLRSTDKGSSWFQAGTTFGNVRSFVKLNSTIYAGSFS